VLERVEAKSGKIDFVNKPLLILYEIEE